MASALPMFVLVQSYRIVFTSDWLEPYTWRQSLSLYLSGREELKRRLHKLSVQVYKSDCADDQKHITPNRPTSPYVLRTMLGVFAIPYCSNDEQ